MARRFEVPFVPNMEDCRLVVRTRYATCYVMDTFCKNFTEEDRARFDRQVVSLMLASERRKRSRKLQEGSVQKG